MFSICVGELCHLGQPPPGYWTMSTTPESHTEGVRHSAQARRAVVEPHEGGLQGAQRLTAEGLFRDDPVTLSSGFSRPL